MFRGARGGAPVERLRRLVDSDTVHARAISRKVRFKAASPGDSGRAISWRAAAAGGGADRRHGERPDLEQMQPRRVCKTDLADLSSLSRCPSMLDPCSYDYSHSSNSANETVRFSLANGREARLNDVLVGCSKSVRGQSFQVADGVMGLGYSNPSLA
ncbi:hypothetical protein SASPL_156672 [Salvia splendens]|uniref:Xylanase inhibitor N-terminal domain-containing protein n=1 Tax=Salvia splendens TaxID=180675 RepID=A0A8X8VWF8_SALSN|nr:hypothetical protein SASPL_156672 [Salvia splendens]